MTINIQEQCSHYDPLGINNEKWERCELSGQPCIMAYDQDIWCGMFEDKEDEPIDTQSQSWKLLMTAKEYYEGGK